MRRTTWFAVAFFLFCAQAEAAPVLFNSDPFAGTTALTTPGRQIVGGEPFISFNTAADQFVFDLAVFGPYGFGPSINFVNDVVGNLPTSGVNVIVLRTLDNDADLGTPFGAGNAATLIAGQLTVSTPGFFVYFNSGLNLPRLVFSTDLSDPTADLKIMARMINFTGAPDSLAGFGPGNFAVVPEPSTWALLALGGAGVVGRRIRRARNDSRTER